MVMTEWIAALRLDLADPESTRFSDEVLERCVLQSVFPMGRDLGIAFGIENGQVVPEPSGEVQEMLLLLARIHACQWMRAATASAFSFSSGDKSVDKTKQPEHWAKLEADLQNQYRARLKEVRSVSGVSDTDAYLMRTPDLAPLIYEQGSDLC